MAGSSVGWGKVKHGKLKGTSVFISKTVGMLYGMNGVTAAEDYRTQVANVIRRLESPLVDNALINTVLQGQPKGAAKSAVAGPSDAEVATSFAASNSSPPLVGAALRKQVQGLLANDENWARVRTMLLGGYKEGSRPSGTDFGGAKIKVEGGASGKQVLLTTFTAAKQIYVTYDATVDADGKITALKFRYAQPKDPESGPTGPKEYTEAQARAQIQSITMPVKY